MGGAMSDRAPCMVCGRSGYHVRGGSAFCARCLREAGAPSPLHLWRDCAALTPAEVAEHAGVSVRSVNAALAGEPVGLRVARKLAELTGIDVAELRAGVEDPTR